MKNAVIVRAKQISLQNSLIDDLMKYEEVALSYYIDGEDSKKILTNE